MINTIKWYDDLSKKFTIKVLLSSFILFGFATDSQSMNVSNQWLNESMIERLGCSMFECDEAFWQNKHEKKENENAIFKMLKTWLEFCILCLEFRIWFLLSFYGKKNIIFIFSMKRIHFHMYNNITWYIFGIGDV